MSDDENLQRQLGDIGLRYLKRTLGEIGALRDHLQNLQQGQLGALKEIELLSHKIHGSGAMFGFDGMSLHARQIEMASASHAQITPQLCEQLHQHIEALAAAANAAAIERNLQQ
jgi:HPt (histidine-containing phosphotransfer) domain-containing protein